MILSSLKRLSLGVITSTLFRLNIFGTAHGLGGDKKAPLPKICHAYFTMIKFGSYTLPKENPRHI